jgi:streptogramin lyase
MSFREIHMQASPSKLRSKLLLALPLAAVLAGCGHGAGGSGGGAIASAKGLHGTAHGGQQGLVGSTVTIFTVGVGGASPTQIASTTTTAGGAFNFPGFSCSIAGESNTALNYVVVSGGAPGSAGNNTAINLVSALGQCQNLPNAINVDEVTTAAAAYALSGFTTVNAGTPSIGASTANSTGLANAFATVATLVNPVTGGATTTLPQASTKTLYALANSLAACVNTSSGASQQCTELFDCALPGATSGSGDCSGGTGAALTDTLSAALSVVKNAGTVSMAGIYDAATRNAVFSPTLSAAPNDWTLSVNYTGGGLDEPYALAIDAAGNVWVANDVNPGVVTELSPTGTPVSATGYTGGGLNNPLDLAIDTSGKVWISNSGNNSVTELVPGATPTLTQISSSQFNHPYGIAVDSAGSIWVANQGNNTLSILSSSGVPGTAATGGGLNAPLGLAATGGGDIWATNGNGTVSEFSTAGTAVSGNSGYGAGSLNVPAGIAAAALANAVVTSNEAGASMSAISASGTGIATVSSVGGLNGPFGIAVDAANNFWIANRGNGALTEISSGATALSPATGFVGNGISGPAGFAVAVDDSGNVWVANHDNNSVTEFVGAGAPTITPLAP